jgi:hypothetical protein
MFQTRTLSSVGLLVLILAAFAVATPSAGAAAQADLTLRITGLEDLGPDAAYEGWLLINGAPVSTGVFAVNRDGALSATRFPVQINDLSKATAFVLTIEPAPDPDPAPSAVHVLGGDLLNNTANLSVAHESALSNDFSNAVGSYVLAAPSAGANGVYKNGIWWLDPKADPGASLKLPTLPAGWVYEGWVVGKDDPVSTGRFTSASGADSDKAGATAGPAAAPAFPGQDFVNPPVDLTSGYAAVISIEPEPDNSPAPFTLKPLLDKTIEDVGMEGSQAMDNNARAFPTGTATLAAGAAVPVPATMPRTGAEDSGAVLIAALAAGLLVLGGLMRRFRPR